MALVFSSDEDNLVKASEAEMANSFDELLLIIARQGEWMAIIGALQLAMRHPAFPETSEKVITNWIMQVIEHIGEDKPATRQIMLMGFDSRFDV